ncbi:MAG: peptidase [Pseudomonadales bacterium]|nr:peptidase [Pseudomonadales bacterium]
MSGITANRPAARCLWLLFWLIPMLVACSDGGGGGGGSGLVPPPPAGWQEGVFVSSENFKNLCADPRTGSFPDQPGTTVDENNWLRSWSHELYLWYDEIVDRNPADYETPEYFDLMKTPETTPSGNPKDQFHFTYPTDVWRELSQSGISAGYGATWAIIARSPPRRVVVAYTEPGSPATSAPANLERGAEILFVDGADVVNGGDQASVDTLNAALFPDDAGETHEFTVRDFGATETRTFTMQSQQITSDPVQSVKTISTANGPVGYMLFNDHIAPSEAQLIDAVEQLGDAAIVDLIIDVRYNGGGYLDIANELSYMIAGSNATAGRIFEEMEFNDQHPTVNPVTGRSLDPVPFHTTAQGFSAPEGTPLPSLGLSRVFMLTGSGTCSASESIMNSLRGIDIEVIQIGSTTCGKPYGFYPADNCGTTYFSIQFRGVNDKGFGDYADGFSPVNVSQPEGISVPGCSVADDFTHLLGDENEARLAAALQYQGDQTCPAATGFGSQRALVTDDTGLGAVRAEVPKSPWLTNRILRRNSP